MKTEDYHRDMVALLRALHTLSGKLEYYGSDDGDDEFPRPDMDGTFNAIERHFAEELRKSVRDAGLGNWSPNTRAGDICNFLEPKLAAIRRGNAA